MQFSFIQFFSTNTIASFPDIIISIILVYYLYGTQDYSRRVIITSIFFLLITSFTGTLLTQLGADRSMTFSSQLSIHLWHYGSTIIFFRVVLRKMNIYIINIILITTFICSSIAETTYILLQNTLYQIPIHFTLRFLINYVILYPIAFYFVFKLLKKINLKKLFDQFFYNKIILVLFTTILILLASTQIIVYQLLPYFIAENSYFVFSIQFAIMFILFFSTAYYLSSKDKIANQKELMKEKNNYLNSLVQIQKEMRLFQHDYKNMLSALYLLAETKNTDDIINYIDESLINIDHKLVEKINITAQLATIRITELKNIIINCLELINEKKIIFTIDIKDTIESGDFDIELICTEFQQYFKQIINETNVEESINIVIEKNNEMLCIKFTSKLDNKILQYLDNSLKHQTDYNLSLSKR